ncbi:Fasciclin II GPI-linked isoform [Operophtera brumata]|uniref:Fasciclin II GPI-linked isoform n=1 Tax=Operophtera brumata TaxID=104452 RepID=A0A0L7LDY9_OPEBR|nr:Fasciclin II GPI-linked isoform [Operophtera brumata]
MPSKYCKRALAGKEKLLYSQVRYHVLMGIEYKLPQAISTKEVVKPILYMKLSALPRDGKTYLYRGFEALKGCSAQNLRIFPKQKQQSVAIGKSVVLTCQAEATDPSLVSQPQWKDPKGQIYTELVPSKQQQYLYISSISRSMAGNYTCVATYTNQPLSASVILDTFSEYLIIIIVDTGDRYVTHTNGLLIKNVEESDEDTYTCRAVVFETGELAERTIKLEVYTAPEMERHDTKNLATTSRYSVNDLTGRLNFDRVEAGDYGKYICIADNLAGQNETGIEVEVLVKPKIFELFNTTAPVGQEGKLECKASGRPAPRISFRRFPNGEQFLNGPNNGSITVETTTRQTGDTMQTIGTIIISKLNRSDDGLYECFAENDGGEARKNALLTVQFRPTFEEMPTMPVWSWNMQPAKQETITATSVSFSIVGPAEDMGPPILSYTAQYKENVNFDWNLANNRTWSVNSPYIVEDLKPMYTYDFRFAAVNQVGSVHGPYADRFELKWKVPAHNGEPIDSYDITCCPCLKEDLKTYEAIKYEIRGLNPDTQYRIHLRAHNVLGFSQPAQIYVQTALGVVRSGYAPPQLLTSGAIIGIALAGILICLIIVDLLLFCFRRQGVIATICGRRGKKHQEDEAKLGSLYGWRFPLPYCSTKPRAPPSPAPLPPPVKLVSTPTDEKEPLREDDAIKRNTSVEFDGHRVDEKEPLREDDAIKRNTSVEFDGHRVHNVPSSESFLIYYEGI